MDRCYCCDTTSEELPELCFVERNGEILCDHCVNTIEENLEDLSINDIDEDEVQ